VKLIIKVTTDEDLPEETLFDCMEAVRDTIKEIGLTVKDIDFQIVG